MNNGPVQVQASLTTSSITSHGEIKDNINSQIQQQFLSSGDNDYNSELIKNKIEIFTKNNTQLISANLNNIPSKYRNNINLTYIGIIKTNQMSYVEAVRKKPNDTILRCQLSQNSLFIAEIFRELNKQGNLSLEEHNIGSQKEKSYIEKAKFENQQAQKLNSLGALPFYVDSMIMEYEGVDCTNIENTGKYIYLLGIAHALDPESKEIKQKYEDALAFLLNRWNILKQENVIDENTQKDWEIKLKQWIENPIRDLFSSNPKLFKLSKLTTYSALFNAHPELKSISAFLEKYPRVGTIRLSGELSQENVKGLLAKFLEDPLASKFPLIRDQAILTPVVADVIKDAIFKYFSKQKTLRVYLGNQDDVNTLCDSFQKDKSIVPNKGTLTIIKQKMEGFNYLIYEIYMPTDNPFVKS